MRECSSLKEQCNMLRAEIWDCEASYEQLCEPSHFLALLPSKLQVIDLESETRLHLEKLEASICVAHERTQEERENQAQVDSTIASKLQKFERLGTVLTITEEEIKS